MRRGKSLSNLNMARRDILHELQCYFSSELLTMLKLLVAGCGAVCLVLWEVQRTFLSKSFPVDYFKMEM